MPRLTFNPLQKRKPTSGFSPSSFNHVIDGAKQNRGSYISSRDFGARSLDWREVPASHN